MPASLIFSFFVAASLYHFSAWVVIAMNADAVPSFVGGLGQLLSAVHLLTLGVLVMTAIGAAMQLLSVVTKRPFGPLKLCWLVACLFIPSVGLFAYGMAVFSIRAMTAGGSLAGLALFVFIALFTENVRKARGIGVTLAHCWTALISLVLLVLVGMTLLVNFSDSAAFDPQGVAAAHFIIAAFGFMGLLAFGFSHILVPMFSLSAAPSATTGFVTLIIAGLGIAAAAIGAALNLPLLMASGAGLGLLATGLHVGAMSKVLAGRMRKRLGVSFLLIRGAWVLLPVSLLLGFMASLGYAGDWGATLFGFLVLFGWLLTFLLGMLQRIIPFLATMHAGTQGGRRPTISEIGNDRALGFHAACHGAAIFGLACGIILVEPPLVMAGALAGIAGAAAFVWFTIGAVAKTFASVGKD